MSAGAGVVVVGAGLGGVTTCLELRRLGYAGPITLVDASSVRPHDRPPLTKAFLTGGEEPWLDLDAAAADVDLRLGTAAVGLDTAAHELLTSAGPIPYTSLVLATGRRARRLPGAGEQVVVADLEDARTLRGRLRPDARIVLIGAGWIGAEVATAALAAGCEVVCLEHGSTPLAGVVGEDLGRRFLPWWSDVDLRTGVSVHEIAPGGVVRTDHGDVTGDVVVVGIGAATDLTWLEQAGLRTDGAGVVVDSGRRTSDADVYAVGDLASRWSDVLQVQVHGGHWDEAVSGATVVAQRLTGQDGDGDGVPYFWSDQFGRKVQYVGQHGPDDRWVLREQDDDRWGVVWIAPAGQATAHLSVGSPRAMVLARAAIAARRPVDEAVVTDLTARW